MKYFIIDGKKYNYDLEFDPLNSENKWKLNAPLIEYCETIGVSIPHYCYHKNLSISGNCRMCLIELKKSPKPIVSCAMDAKSSLAANTEIHTNSPLVKKARENIMEFLLLNHPLDCPICDQGGECDLQDQSLFFGITKKRFYNYKRIVIDKNIGPIVKTVMTRCIHCTRCVRFAAEIAGVEDLGVFGRGMKSEIGTYVNRAFQSELSGNVTDLCPVGALTLKPYPFMARSWELKSVNSIDFTDGFGANIQILLKNNKIIKVLPNYNPNESANTWISDKTRFAFSGMFSVSNEIPKNKKSDLFWNSLFRDIVHTIYFYDHINRHFFSVNPLIIIFDNNISIEVLSLLLLLNKKFPFFKLKKCDNIQVDVDFEGNLQLNSHTKTDELEKSENSILIGTNPRYEGPNLNLTLKKRLAKGNYNIHKLGCLTDMTYSANFLGSNIKNLKSIAEGTHNVNKIIHQKSPTPIITNLNIFSRIDSTAVHESIKNLTQTTKTYNVLNQNLNSVGVNNLGQFDNITTNDLTRSSSLYFINVNINHPQITKFIELKLLNHITQPLLNKTVIEQNKIVNNIIQEKKLNSHKYLNLPNTNFYESTGTYRNTEGVLKKTTKILPSTKNVKNDWQIIRKLHSYLRKVKIISNPEANIILQYNANNISGFKNFINLLYLNTQNLSKSGFEIKNSSNQEYVLKNRKLKIRKTLIHKTQLKKHIDDFFLGGNDKYSINSPTMVDCSNTLRINSTNFK